MSAYLIRLDRVAILLMLFVFPLISMGATAVVLRNNIVFNSVAVNPNTASKTNAFADIDLHDNANLLVLAVPGETADITEVSFGGTAMTLTNSYATSYNKAGLFVLFSPETGPGQTLRIVSKNNSTAIYGGYSPQVFSFRDVAGIGAMPTGGSSGAATVSLDFLSVTNNAYLLMTASAQNNGNPSYEPPATNLTAVATGSGGWSARSGGEVISADAASKTVDVTSSDRFVAIGIELQAPPPPPAGTVLIVR
jgi:hypothetical protein